MTVAPTAVTAVTIAPDTGRVLLGYGLRLSATPRDVMGAPVTGRCQASLCNYPCLIPRIDRLSQ